MPAAGRIAEGPSRRVLWLLVLLVLALHAALLLGVTAPLQVHLSSAPAVSAVQVRVVPPPPQAQPAPRRSVVRKAPAPAAPPETLTEPQGPSPVQTAAEPEASAPVAQASQTAVSAAAEVPSAAASTPAPTPAPVVSEASPPLPLISLGALPPSRVLSYQLTGMDKGLTYYANGELRWQHNDTAYELTLSVRAFLIGSRQWRSVGQIDATGLAPRRFSDSWRNERAAHFDREQQRVVFSSNSTPAPLQPGAQDQVSLYVQLAAAMAGEPERFAPGTRLQVQTVTVRDAVPWSLVLQGAERMDLDGQSRQVSHWVCQPRNQYDAKVEFWVAAEQAWLPVRIRITQASGSYIDLLWRGTEPLPPLALGADTTPRNKGS
jgi:hypothetical protein